MPDPGSKQFQVGQVIGGCQIVGQLGRGSSGTIFQAVQLSLERPVAIKVLSSEDAAPAEMDALLAEARTVGQIDHPNIVRVFNAGVDQGRPYIVMELLEGRTLQQRLTKDRIIPMTEALSLAGEIARGLFAAHRVGIVHRDLKPSNIFLRKAGRPKLIDFGMARPFRGKGSAAREGGTPEYMAPEQWRRQATDARTDLYSLGLILYRMIAGVNAFSGDLDVLRAGHLQKPVPIPNPRPAVLNDNFFSIIVKLTRKAPAERYTTAEEFLLDLDRFQSKREPLAVEDLRGRVTCPICDTENPAGRQKCEGCNTDLTKIDITIDEMLPEAPPPQAPKRPPLPPPIRRKPPRSR